MSILPEKKLKKFLKKSSKNVLTIVLFRANMLERSRERTNARVVELADSLDSGSSVHSGRAGSSPASRTNKKRHPFGCRFSFLFFGGVAFMRFSAIFCGRK